MLGRHRWCCHWCERTLKVAAAITYQWKTPNQDKTKQKPTQEKSRAWQAESGVLLLCENYQEAGRGSSMWSRRCSVVQWSEFWKATILLYGSLLVSRDEMPKLCSLPIGQKEWRCHQIGKEKKKKLKKYIPSTTSAPKARSRDSKKMDRTAKTWNWVKLTLPEKLQTKMFKYHHVLKLMWRWVWGKRKYRGTMFLSHCYI